MKRSLIWGVIAAAGAALMAPGMFAQVTEPPSDVSRDWFIATSGAPLEEAAKPPILGDPLLAAADDVGTLRLIKGKPGEAAGEERMKLERENAELSAAVHDLAMKLRDAEGEDRRKAEDQLAEKVSRQFDVRQEMRERQLKALEEQVRRLRDIHDERADQRDRIIDDRVQQLVREAQGLGWGDGGEGGAFKMSWSADAAPAYIFRGMDGGRGDEFVSGRDGGRGVYDGGRGGFDGGRGGRDGDAEDALERRRKEMGRERAGDFGRDGSGGTAEEPAEK